MTVIQRYKIYGYIQKSIFALGLILLLLIVLSFSTKISNIFLNYSSMISDLATTLAAGTLVLAIIDYWYRRRQNVLLRVSEQLSFFRKEVLAPFEEMSKLMSNGDPDYEFSKIKLLDYSIKSIAQNYSKEFTIQQEFYKDLEISSKQISVLNAMEELSIRIVHSKTYNHEALSTLKDSFIDVIEVCAFTLITTNTIVTQGTVYNYMMSLYKEWKPLQDQTTINERIDKIMKLEK